MGFMTKQNSDRTLKKINEKEQINYDQQPNLLFYRVLLFGLCSVSSVYQINDTNRKIIRFAVNSRKVLSFYF